MKAAVELFSRKGFDGVRTAEIARLCGLPKANVYYYFASKEDIYVRIIEGLLSGWDEALEHISADREPREAISGYIAAKLENSRKQAAETRFFANEMMRGGAFVSRAQRRHIQEVTRRHTRVVEGWIDQGKLRRMNPLHFFILLWSATESYADSAEVIAIALEKRRITQADFDDARETITSIVLGGCLPPDQASA